MVFPFHPSFHHQLFLFFEHFNLQLYHISFYSKQHIDNNHLHADNKQEDMQNIAF